MVARCGIRRRVRTGDHKGPPPSTPPPSPLRKYPLIFCNYSAGVPGDAVSWPEREVSSPLPLFPHLPPQAAQGRYLRSYNFLKIIIGRSTNDDVTCDEET